MRRADEIVQNMTRTHTQDIVQDVDFCTLSACADSMRHACDVLRVCNQSPMSIPWLMAALQPKLLPENRPRLDRIEVGLADVIMKLAHVSILLACPLVVILQIDLESCLFQND